MKSSKEIKKELHEYIDSIGDEESLWVLHEDVAEYLKKKKETEPDAEDNLTAEEISEINKGLEQIEKDQTVDWDEYLKATARWQTK